MIYLSVWNAIFQYENSEDYRGDVNPEIWVKYYTWNSLNTNLKDTYKIIKNIIKQYRFNEVSNVYHVLKSLTHLFGAFCLYNGSDPWAHELDKVGDWFYTDTTPADVWEQLQIWLDAFINWVQDK